MTQHPDLYQRAYQRCFDSEYDRHISAGDDQHEATRKAREMAEKYAARVDAAGSAD